MEQEYKWCCTGAQQFEAIPLHPSVAPLVRKQQCIEMEARYYDSADGLVSRLGGSLRLRRENDASVCCLKLASRNRANGSCKIREEFECAAPDIDIGLNLLPQVGAPQDVCTVLLTGGVTELGFTRFTRRAYLLDTDDCTAELAFDSGSLGRGGKTAPICEIELELKSGSSTAFQQLAQTLQQTFSLTGQSLSKLGRMMSL